MKKLLTAADTPREPVEWLWRDRIPRGMISLVAGLPGVGKSLFAYFSAGVTASRGENVIYATGEEGYRKTARPRIEAVIANPADLKRIAWWPRDRELPRDLDELHARIVEQQAALVVLDPVAAFLGVSIFNDQEVRRALMPLTEIAEATGAAILLVSHTVKSISSRAHPMDAIGGSGGGLRAAARMVHLFGPGEDDDEVRLSLVKTNVSRNDIPSYVFELDVREFDDVDPVPYLIEVGESEESSLDDARIMLKEAGVSSESKDAKRARAAEFLIRLLRNGSMKGSEIHLAAQIDGHSDRTIRRAANDIGVIRPRGGPNSMWSLPQELLDSLDDNDDDANTPWGDGNG
jgi:putative DNA primase/helicase